MLEISEPHVHIEYENGRYDQLPRIASDLMDILQQLTGATSHGRFAYSLMYARNTEPDKIVLGICWVSAGEHSKCSMIGKVIIETVSGTSFVSDIGLFPEGSTSEWDIRYSGGRGVTVLGVGALLNEAAYAANGVRLRYTFPMLAVSDPYMSFQLYGVDPAAEQAPYIKSHCQALFDVANDYLLELGFKVSDPADIARG